MVSSNLLETKEQLLTKTITIRVRKSRFPTAINLYCQISSDKQLNKEKENAELGL